ncbi:MAG: hypothetical protein AB2651_02515 [Candidatus Thiodiazotropha sp.]
MEYLQLMCVDEIVSTLKDLCIAGAAVTTAFVAWKGVESWKRELQGKADFEVARNLIKATYQVRNSIQICRSPWLELFEFPEGYQHNKIERTSEDEGYAKLFIYNNRLKHVDDCIIEFDTTVLEAEALWGRIIEDKALALRKCTSELKSAIDSVIRDAYSGGSDFTSDKEFAQEMKEIVQNIDPKTNSFTKKINSAISDIETLVRPHLSRNKQNLPMR